MIYLFCALYEEARPFLERWNLKKEKNYPKYQVFSSEKITCIITGLGPMKMAIHTSHFLSSKTISSKDMFFNIGFAGCSNPKRKIGEIFFIQKIHSHDSGRDFYPALLYEHPFFETGLETFSHLVNQADLCQEELIDMEGAAFFESISFFAKQKQIILLKMISDFLKGEEIELKSLQEKMQTIIPWIEQFLTEEETHPFPWKAEGKIKFLAEKLCCSETMSLQLEELLRYAFLKGFPWETIEERVKKQNIESKREGKKYLEDLQQFILQG